MYQNLSELADPTDSPSDRAGPEGPQEITYHSTGAASINQRF